VRVLPGIKGRQIRAENLRDANRRDRSGELFPDSSTGSQRLLPGRVRRRIDLCCARSSDDGKPLQSPEPKAERQLLVFLGSKAALVVMTCLLVVVAFTLIVLIVARMA
jgi:hypothetical protein